MPELGKKLELPLKVNYKNLSPCILDMKFDLCFVIQLHTNINQDCENCFQAKYVAECLDEIKSELRQDNIAVKAIAVNKLTYVCIL